MKLATQKIKFIFMSLTAMAMSIVMSVSAYADNTGGSNAAAGGGLAASAAVTGTQNLINDAMSWLLVIAPTVGIVVIVYFMIRRSAADEMDQKKWNNRIITAAISTVGAVLSASLLSTILSYYQ